MSIDHQKLISDFKSGICITEIAELCGVTRQRVQQILKKHGISAKDGGLVIKKEKLRAEKLRLKQQSLDSKSLNLFGCTHDELMKIPRSAKLAYIDQRNNAKLRDIGWAFTLYTWWRVWETSGMWEKRGKGIGATCMARKNDVGIYSPDNVYICTSSQNIKDYYKTDLFRTRHMARKKSLQAPQE